MGTVSVAPLCGPFVSLDRPVVAVACVVPGCLARVAAQRVCGWFVSVGEGCARVDCTGCAQSRAGVWH